MKEKEVYKWNKRFCEEREHMTDKNRSLRPVTCRTEENRANFVELHVKIVG